MHPSHILQHSLKHVHRRCRWCRCNHTGRCAECRVSWGRCHKWLQCFLSSTCTETVLGLERKNSSHSPMLMLTFMHEAWSIYIIIMGIYIFLHVYTSNHRPTVQIKRQIIALQGRLQQWVPVKQFGDHGLPHQIVSFPCKFEVQKW